MPRTRRRKRGGSTFQSNSPAAPAVSTPPPPPSSGRRSAVAAAASASKASVSGRTTQNSRGNRGRRPARRNPPVGRNAGARGRRKKDSTPLQDPTSYKDENGEVYKKGGEKEGRTVGANLCFCVCIVWGGSSTNLILNIVTQKHPNF